MTRKRASPSYLEPDLNSKGVREPAVSERSCICCICYPWRLLFGRRLLDACLSGFETLKTLETCSCALLEMAHYLLTCLPYLGIRPRDGEQMPEKYERENAAIPTFSWTPHHSPHHFHPSPLSNGKSPIGAPTRPCLVPFFASLHVHAERRLAQRLSRRQQRWFQR